MNEGEFIFKWCFYCPRRCSISYSPLKSYAVQNIEIIVKQGSKILNFPIQYLKKINRLDFQHNIYFEVFYISVTIIASLHCISTHLSTHFKYSSFYMLFDGFSLSRLLKLSDSKVKCCLILQSFLHSPIFISSHKKIERMPCAEI